MSFSVFALDLRDSPYCVLEDGVVHQVAQMSVDNDPTYMPAKPYLSLCGQLMTCNERVLGPVDCLACIARSR